jgi:glutathione S-transferase
MRVGHFVSERDLQMLLIGMFDSPFVRRVAVSLHRLAIPFEHANWSVGADHARIREYSALGRVPTLVLDDGAALTDSSAILDYLDSAVGAERALVPCSGTPRRDAMQLVALGLGAAEKGREQVYERVFRPAEKRHEPYLERCRSQMYGALGELESWRASHPGSWITGEQLTQADITVACCWTFLVESVALDASPYSKLATLVARCEELPEFAATRVRWSPPRS